MFTHLPVPQEVLKILSKFPENGSEMRDCLRTNYRFKKPEIAVRLEERRKLAQEQGQPVYEFSERSILLFKLGRVGQGYACFLDLRTFVIDIIPAYNKNDGRVRDDFFIGDINYRVESPHPLGQLTGVIHTQGLKKLGKENQGYIICFGMWKGNDEEPIIQIRNRSSQNSQTIAFEEELLLWSYHLTGSPHHSFGRMACADIFLDIVESFIYILQKEDGTWSYKFKETITNISSIKIEMAFVNQTPTHRFKQIVKNFKNALFDNTIIAEKIFLWILNNLKHFSIEPETIPYLVLAGGLFNRHDIIEKYRAEINQVNELLQTCLQMAIAVKNKKLVKLFLKYGVEINNSCFFKRTPLLDAILVDDIEIVELLIKRGALLSPPRECTPPLHFAILHGCDIAIVKLLIDHGAGVNTLNLNMQTPLYCAVIYGKIEVAKFLLQDSNTDPNIADFIGFTPLIIAMLYNKDELFTLLLQHPRTDVNQPDKQRNTPLCICTARNDYPAVNFLLNFGANPLLKNISGKSAIDFAYKNKNMSIMKILLKQALDSYNKKLRKKIRSADPLVMHSSNSQVKLMLTEYLLAKLLNKSLYYFPVTIDLSLLNKQDKTLAKINGYLQKYLAYQQAVPVPHPQHNRHLLTLYKG